MRDKFLIRTEKSVTPFLHFHKN